LIPRVQEYQQKSELCDGLALQAKDAGEKIALMAAARQWRDRASLLARTNTTDPLLGRTKSTEARTRQKDETPPVDRPDTPPGLYRAPPPLLKIDAGHS
jgi:hypothetical protein